VGTIGRNNPMLATRPRKLHDALRSGDNPAHQSMITRRFMIVPPALANSGHAEQLGKHEEIVVPLLDMANMRAPA
jgi:hypothetical protein